MFELKMILLVLISVEIIVKCIIAQRNPKILPQGEDKIWVHKGNKAQIICMVENLGENTVSWVKIKDQMGKDTFRIIASGGTRVGRDRYTVMNYFNQYSLEIREVNEEDAGQYQCQISTDPVIYRNFWLNVYFAPKITYTPSDIHAQEGSDVRLFCEATGSPKPKIFWRRLDNTALPLGGLKYIGSEMDLKGLHRSHRGSYVCVAVSDSGRDERVVSVLMEFAPKIITEKFKFRVPTIIGTNVVLECKVEGDPKANIHWTHQGMEVHGDRYKTTQLDEGYDVLTSDLTIISAQTSDLGEYICVAVNNFGNDEKTFELITQNQVGFNASPQNRLGMIMLLPFLCISLFLS